MSARVRRTEAAWPRLSIYQDLQAENAALRSEIDHLHALLAPVALPCPARWHLSSQERALLTLLYHQAGCVAYDRLRASLGSPEAPVSLKHLQVVACNTRRKLSAEGIEIEAHWGCGYGLTVEGREALTRALDALQSLRVSLSGKGR